MQEFKHLQPCLGEQASQFVDAPVNPLHRGVHLSVVKHAKEYHGFEDADAYRRVVLTGVPKQWPEFVTAQEMRLSYDR